VLVISIRRGYAWPCTAAPAGPAGRGAGVHVRLRPPLPDPEPPAPHIWPQRTPSTDTVDALRAPQRRAARPRAQGGTRSISTGNPAPPSADPSRLRASCAPRERASGTEGDVPIVASSDRTSHTSLNPSPAPSLIETGSPERRPPQEDSGFPCAQRPGQLPQKHRPRNTDRG